MPPNGKITWGYFASGGKISAVATGGQAVPPLTTASAPPFRFTLNTFLEHHVTIKQQAIKEKEIITFKNNSRLKFFPFFAKLVANNCCTYMQGRTQGGVLGVQPPPPIGLSTKMHNKENISFLALLNLFFCNDMDSNMI